MSGAGLPCLLRATTDFVFVRMHGPDRQHLYAGSYPDADLRWWAGRIREWDRAGQDVFVYFNNDGEANAVRNCADPTDAAQRMTACGPRRRGLGTGAVVHWRVASTSPDARCQRGVSRIAFGGKII